MRRRARNPIRKAISDEIAIVENLCKNDMLSTKAARGQAADAATDVENSRFPTSIVENSRRLRG